MTTVIITNTDAVEHPVGSPGEGGGIKTFTAGLTSKGYEKIPSLVSATALKVPSGATIALIQPETQGIRWRDDGVDPTANTGMILAAGESLFFTGSLSSFRAIEVTTSAILHITYYN